MSAVTGFAPGQPCWIDLSTSDMAKAEEFYGRLFGWQFEDTGPQFGGYRMVTKDGHAVAGAMSKMDPSMPEAWTVYLSVADAQVTSAAVKGAGGTVVFEPMVVGPRGTMMLIQDSAGAFVGGWQAADFAGFEIEHQHGAPYWFETLSKEYENSVSFYQNAFGWLTFVMSDTEELRYTTLGRDEHARGGIMDAAGFLPKEVPSNWQFYLQVDDADEALVQTVALGGTVLREAWDTPFGRIGQIADPGGAVLSVAQPLAR